MSSNRTFFKKWAYNPGAVELKGSFQANGSVTAVTLANNALRGGPVTAITRSDVGQYKLTIPMVFPAIDYVSANVSTTFLGIVAQASYATNTTLNTTTLTINCSRTDSAFELTNDVTNRINWEIQARNSTVTRGQ